MACVTWCGGFTDECVAGLGALLVVELLSAYERLAARHTPAAMTSASLLGLWVGKLKLYLQKAGLRIKVQGFRKTSFLSPSLTVAGQPGTTW